MWPILMPLIGKDPTLISRWGLDQSSQELVIRRDPLPLHLHYMTSPSSFPGAPRMVQASVPFHQTPHQIKAGDANKQVLRVFNLGTGPLV